VNKMILFYSTYCSHCRMLLETIQRHDTTNQIKLVCVEVLRSKGQTIPVTTVPTLITLPERRVLVGKAVFDYLLLPGSGKLLISVQKADPAQGQGQAPAAAAAAAAPSQNDPVAFSLTALNGSFGDQFTDINHTGSTTNTHLEDRGYQWTLIDNNAPISVGNFSPEETRNKKQTIDLDSFKMQRDMDLHSESDLTSEVVLPPSFTR